MAKILNRRHFLGRACASSLLLAIAPDLLAAQDQEITPEAIARAERLAGISFNEAERKLMATSVKDHLDGLKDLLKLQLGNEVAPATTFSPLSREEVLSDPPAEPRSYDEISLTLDPISTSRRPQALKDEDLAFATVFQLSHLLRHRVVSSVELTHFFLDRLERLNEKLQCVITFTVERALEKAAKADAEIAAGRYRGPLHGIPWGAKDLLAVEGYHTTWGCKPYEKQMIDEDAEVVRRLDEAGAVLIAKTSVGALAWGDVWFGGTTKNPWNLEQGSSGSSAGSASAVAAGALPFALGTETLGSIVSPASRCGATGLRPTFGRVPRTGCMALSWTMDKIGVLARSVEDTALVLSAMHGANGADRDAVTAPLDFHAPSNLENLHFGMMKAAFESEYDDAAFDRAALKEIEKLGVVLEPLELPELPVGDMLVVLDVEAAAAFDQLTRSNRDDEMVRQVKDAWPNVFRAGQLVPGVQYVQAQRARSLLQKKFEEMLGNLDGYVCPSFVGRSLLDTNLTGHPCVVLPNGFREDGTPTSMTFIGRNYGEGAIVALATAYQRATGWNRKRPAL